MKKNLIAAAAVALLATSAAFAQGVDTLAKIKSAGVSIWACANLLAWATPWAVANMWAFTPKWPSASLTT